MSRKSMGNYTERDYSYNSRSRSSDSTRSFVFVDSAKRKGSGMAGGIILIVVFAALAAWAVLLFQLFNK